MVNRKSPVPAKQHPASPGRLFIAKYPDDLISDRLGAIVNVEMAPTDTCATCKHFVPFETADGYCRRYPPSLKIDGISSAYVPVKAEWVCGEYQGG